MPDASVGDAGNHTGSDAGVDAGSDAGVPVPDAGETDAGVDAGFDAGVDAGFDAGTDAGSTDAGSTDGGALTADGCFDREYVNPSTVGPNYDQFHPVVGSHCLGTNHQNIQGVERVVFLGDSLTVGTPPANFNPAAVYRAKLSARLAMLFGLPTPGVGWGGADPFSGVALPAETGPYVSCAEWGGHNSDLLTGSEQIQDCFPTNKRNLRTLVVMTMGGNDVATITREGGGMNPTKTILQLQADAQDAVDRLRSAVEWLKNPVNVPGGAYVVFTNNYEFTDGTGDVASCPAAGLSGIEPWQDTVAQRNLMVWMSEQYLKIAVDTQSDLVFALEKFCGHGYQRNNPAALCYRGPNQAMWFDTSCTHPTEAGHQALSDFFFETIVQ